MSDKALPVQIFLETLTKWMAAIEDCRVPDAEFQAGQMKAVAKLLAYDPEFKSIYARLRDSCNDDDPAQVVECISAFLRAVTDAACSGEYRRAVVK